MNTALAMLSPMMMMMMMIIMGIMKMMAMMIATTEMKNIVPIVYGKHGGTLKTLGKPFLSTR